VIGEPAIRKWVDKVLSVSPADETEVLVFGLEERLTRFANNTIHQNVAETDVGLVVRAAVGRRTGVTVTNDLSDAGLERAVETAVHFARLQPEDPHYPGLPDPVSVEPVPAFDEQTAAYTPEDRAREVAVICRRAEEAGVNASGAFRTAIYEFAVANSHGVFVYHPATIADLTTVVMTDTSAGYAAGASWRVGEVDVPALGDEAIRKALRGRNPRPLEPGVYPVVLEPYAVGDIVSFITGMAGGMAVAEGRSWMTGREEGEMVASPLVSIWDDGRDPEGWPLPFDFEGMPRQRVDIIREGAVGGPVYDRRWAAITGKKPTGHALPAANPFSQWLTASAGPASLHPVMGPGPHTLEEMVASTDYGLYVTRFHYTRVVHPRQAVITGMTRDGTFLIERGEITVPVKNLRFTQSYVEALANGEMVGREVHGERPDFDVVRAPALKISAFHFTGVTEF